MNYDRLDEFTLNFYKGELWEKTTTSSKKAHLTRLKKGLVEYLNDLEIARERYSCMLHGEYVTYDMILETKQEIQYIDELYTNL